MRGSVVFLKLVVLILVLGSSGVGMLSVRQSRLQAVHEMAEARHRIRRLSEQAGEVRTLISQSCTPDRVHAMLTDPGAYRPAIHNPARIELAPRTIEAMVDQGAQTPGTREPEPKPVPGPALAPAQDRVAQGETAPAPNAQGERVWIDPQGRSHHIWMLEDGSRVVFVEN